MAVPVAGGFDLDDAQRVKKIAKLTGILVLVRAIGHVST
jgi:hypothetical protein